MHVRGRLADVPPVAAILHMWRKSVDCRHRRPWILRVHAAASLFVRPNHRSCKSSGEVRGMSCAAETSQTGSGHPLACWSSSPAVEVRRAGAVSRAGAVRPGHTSLGGRGLRGSCRTLRAARMSGKHSGRSDWRLGDVFSRADRKIYKPNVSLCPIANKTRHVSAGISLLDIGSAGIMLDLEPLIMIPSREIGCAMRRRSTEPATCWRRSLKLNGEL